MSGTRNNVAVWFELPALDFSRAVAFYQALFGVELKQETIGPMRLAAFPYSKPHVSGAIVEGAELKPSADGAIVYLNADGRLDDMLASLEELGGRQAGSIVELPAGMGRFALIIDTEGNRVGLHEAA